MTSYSLQNLKPWEALLNCLTVIGSLNRYLANAFPECTQCSSLSQRSFGCTQCRPFAPIWAVHAYQASHRLGLGNTLCVMYWQYEANASVSSLIPNGPCHSHHEFWWSSLVPRPLPPPVSVAWEQDWGHRGNWLGKWVLPDVRMGQKLCHEHYWKQR